VVLERHHNDGRGSHPAESPALVALRKPPAAVNEIGKGAHVEGYGIAPRRADPRNGVIGAAKIEFDPIQAKFDRAFKTTRLIDSDEVRPVLTLHGVAPDGPDRGFQPKLAQYNHGVSGDLDAGAPKDGASAFVNPCRFRQRPARKNER